MSTVNAAADDPLIGTRIDGRYTVHAVLGQGGMGVVYEGVHDELGRPVAIKVLNAAWATDRTAVERFLREARTASSFSHGNIVDVTDLGRLADGRPFLVMPKISGIDLATLLAETGPQPAKRVAGLLGGVAAALDLVHAKGYVHRDIKPENMMYVVREDGSETVMLLDFGIAAAVMSSGPRLTRQGSIFGTPHYLPPEVCAGQRSDARGDVYALAAVAFELITGALPFPIEDIMQLMAVKVTQDAPSLAAASGHAFPPEVEAVIARGMARDPNVRYPSASAFVNALRSATEYAPVSWQTGVLRSNMRSAEHVLPQPVQGQHPSHAPMTRAPTMPAEAHPSHPSYPRQPSQPFDDRSYPSQPQRSREASYPQQPSRGPQPMASGEGSYPRQPSHGMHPMASGESSYPRQPSHGMHPMGSGEGSHPRQPGYAPPQTYNSGPGYDPAQPQYRTNEGVWGMHAGDAAGYGAQDTRLRMTDERRYQTAQLPRRSSSAGRYVLGALALAAIGFGVMQMLAQKERSITDTRPSTAQTPVPQTPPSELAASPAANPVVPSAPTVPPRARPGAAPLPAARAPEVVPSPAAPQPAAAIDSPALQPTAAAAINGAGAARSEGTPGAPGAQPSAAQVAAQEPTAPVVAPAPSRAEPAPVRAPSASSARSAARSREPSYPSNIPEPSTPPVPAAPPPQIVTLTPAAPEPEPEPAAPAAPVVDTASAAALARDSGSALLRGEVSRAVELARRATKADPAYAGGWRSLGLALERGGASADAAAAYSEYLQRAPTGPQADMVRQRMQAMGH